MIEVYFWLFYLLIKKFFSKFYSEFFKNSILDLIKIQSFFKYRFFFFFFSWLKFIMEKILFSKLMFF